MFSHSIRLFLALAAVALISGCGSGSSASPPVGGLTLAPTDGQIMVSWNQDSSVQYDLWYAPTPDVTACQSTNGGIPSGCQIRTHITSPYSATALINGVTYYFVMNSRKSNGPAGSNTSIASAAPSLAGTKWQVGASLGSTDMRGITYGGFTINTLNALGVPIGYFVAVGNGGVMYKSTNGVAWTPVPSPTGSSLNAALFAQSYFIAAGASGSILYSLDTVTWTAVPPINSQTLNALASNAGLQRCYGILVGTVAPLIDYFVPQSPCGFSGSKGNTASLIVAVGDSGTILYSNGGVTWAAATTVPTPNNLRGVTYMYPNPATTTLPSGSAGAWIAVGAGGTLISSVNGVNWTAVTSPTTNDLNSVAVLATTDSATLATTFTAVAVGNNGTVLTSPDGIHWTSQTVSPASNLNAVTAWSQFVAVGAGGNVFTSLNGTTWSLVTSGTAATLYGVIGEAGQYTAIGQGGASIYSQH